MIIRKSGRFKYVNKEPGQGAKDVVGQKKMHACINACRVASMMVSRRDREDVKLLQRYTSQDI